MIGSIVTNGYGSWSNPSFVVTMGYGPYSSSVVVQEPVWFNALLLSGVSFVSQFDTGIGENVHFSSGTSESFGLEGEEELP